MLRKIARTSGHVALKIGEHAAYIGFFPYAVLVERVWNDGYVPWSTRKFLKTRWLDALGFLGLGVLANASHVTSSEMYEETKDFETPRDDDVIVVAITDSDPNKRAEFERDIRERYGDKVEYVHATEYWKFIADLEKIALRRGRITRLDVYGHGYPGGFMTGKEGSSVTGADRTGQTVIFAKNAKVRFFTCYTGAREKGEAFMKNFGKEFLVDGGEIAANQTLSYPSHQLSGKAASVITFTMPLVSLAKDGTFYLEDPATRPYLVFDSRVRRYKVEPRAR